MSEMQGNKFILPAAALLLAAILATFFVGDTGFGESKITGVLLALIAFIPVFVMQVRAMKDGDPNLVLGTFVGGFFFKLIALGVGVWWGVKKAGFPLIDFSTACLSFLIVFQIIESLYFARRGKS